MSLFNSMLAMQMQEAAVQIMRAYDLNWAAMPLSGVFETTDGALVLVGAFKANPLRDICAALEIEDLSADPRFADLGAQIQRARLPAEDVARGVRHQQHGALAGAARGAGPAVRAGADLREALDDPQTVHNDVLLESSPARASRCAPSARRSR